jgi:hypothetical protein
LGETPADVIVMVGEDPPPPLGGLGDVGVLLLPPPHDATPIENASAIMPQDRRCFMEQGLRSDQSMRYLAR